MEIPPAGAAGIQLTGISEEEHQQFSQVVDKVDKYSQHLVSSFDSITKQINEKLNAAGGISMQALEALQKAHDALTDLSKEKFEQFDQIMNQCDSIIKQLSGLDAVQNELLLLSDLLTAVEETVNTTQNPA